MTIPLTPPPREAVADTKQWRDWFYGVYAYATQGGQQSFNGLNFLGSNITSIVTRDHNDLTNIQGGTLTDRQHLTSTQVSSLVLTSGSYLNPSWITGIPYSVLTGTVPTWNQNTTGTAATITGVYSGTLTSSQVTTALTYTPYNVTNPSGYQTAAQVRTAVDSSTYSLQAPTTGFSITIGANISHLILNPVGTLAVGSITMPASPVDGYIVTVSTSQIITALTVSPNTGQTVKNAPTTLQLNATTPGAISGFGFSYIYNLSSTTWFRIY